MASAFDVPVVGDAGRGRSPAEKLYWAMAFRSSLHILQRLLTSSPPGKKSFWYCSAIPHRRSGEWSRMALGPTTGSFGNSSARDDLRDTLTSHVADYAEFSVSPDQYAGACTTAITRRPETCSSLSRSRTLLSDGCPHRPAYRDRRLVAMQAAKLA